MVGAIGALKGPLHGGANEAVLHIFDEFGDAAEVEAWLDRALAEKRYADAMAILARMHEMAPQNALILNNLAWAAKEHGLRQFTLPAEEQKEIDARLAPLADAYVQRVSAQGLDGKQILSDVRALKAKHEKASREKGN